MDAFLSRLHRRASRQRSLRYLAALCRLLLAVGFVAPGVTKLLGYDFAPGIPAGTPIGDFFDAFLATGLFYRFVGLAQISAAFLLLFDRTVVLGALVYFPIILCVFVLTVALNFGGTEIVTGLMLLACLYVLAWNYPRLRGILFSPSEPGLVQILTPSVLAKTAWWTTAAALIGITLSQRLAGASTFRVSFLLLIVGAGLWVVVLVRSRASTQQSIWTPPTSVGE